MLIDKYLTNNQLTEALNAAKDLVRAKPADSDGRSLLGLLYCFDAQWDKADRQFTTAAQQSSELQVGVSLIRQLVRGEAARQDFFFRGGVPELMYEPDAAVEALFRAVISDREQNDDDVKVQVLKLQAGLPNLSGTVNRMPFEYARDLDDFLSQFLEIISLNGKYYLIPLRQVSSINFHKPEKLQDQIWRSADLNLVSGFQGVVYLPTCYCKAPSDDKLSDPLKLGGETDWVACGGDGPVRGRGQKMFLFGETVLSMMELEAIEVVKESQNVPH